MFDLCKADGVIFMTKRKYEPLPMPTGKFNSRQKAIWKAITSEIPPGMVAKGNEVLLLSRLVKAQWRCEFLELELEEVLQQTQTACVIGGNGQVTTHALFTQIERATSTVANLSQKLKLCPAARLESKAAVTGDLAGPDERRDPEDLLFMGAQPATAAEKARWKQEGKLN
jgi:hypothetical protein